MAVKKTNKKKTETQSNMTAGWVKTKEDFTKLMNKIKCCDKDKKDFGSLVRWADLPLYMKIGIVGGILSIIYIILENWNYSHLL